MTDQPTTNGILVERSENKVNIVMDMSTFDLFDLCKARYDFRHNHLKAVPIHKKSKSLDKGSILHEGLEVYFSMLKGGKHYNERLHAGITRIQAVSSDPEQCNLEPQEVNIVISALEQSCEYWRFEDENMDILEVENPFAYSLYEDEFVRIIITGKIDLLVNIHPLGNRAGYTNLPIDHKSFERDFEVPRLSNQFKNYANAVGSNYLIVNRVGLQKTLKPEDKFKRVPLSYDPIMLGEWKEDIVRAILHEYLDCVSSNYWRRSYTSCFAWNRKCEYYEICETSGKEAKLFKLEQQFSTVSPWDVTAKFNKS